MSLMDKIDVLIEKYKMLSVGDSVVVGVSGGPDSMCLLHVLHTLADKWKLTLYAAHLNHCFRGKEADADALYVEEICKKWGIPAYFEKFDVPAYIQETGLSPEEAGREIRYKLFDRVCKETGATKIAVAQNLNDHTETILMHFMRGSGIEGLKGIEHVRENKIRPLIETSRQDIEAYCDEYGLEPRIDKTNLEPVYARNKVRLELIPYIKDNFNPNIMEALVRLSEIAKLDNGYLEEQAAKYFSEIALVEENKITLNTGKLAEIHDAMKRRVIRRALEELAGSFYGFEFKHVEHIVELIGKSTGAAVILPKNLKAYISYESLVLAKNLEKTSKKWYYNLKYGCENAFDETGAVLEVAYADKADIAEAKKDKNILFIDASKVKESLIYRNRQDGDIFAPIGLKGTKKLKDYFIDEKIPKEERDNIELVADGKEIVWVIGKRLSEKYKITGETKEILVIKYFRRSYNA